MSKTAWRVPRLCALWAITHEKSRLLGDMRRRHTVAPCLIRPLFTSAHLHAAASTPRLLLPSAQSTAGHTPFHSLPLWPLSRVEPDRSLDGTQRRHFRDRSTVTLAIMKQLIVEAIVVLVDYHHGITRCAITKSWRPASHHGTTTAAPRKMTRMSIIDAGMYLITFLVALSDRRPGLRKAPARLSRNQDRAHQMRLCLAACSLCSSVWPA